MGAVRNSRLPDAYLEGGWVSVLGPWPRHRISADFVVHPMANGAAMTLEEVAQKLMDLTELVGNIAKGLCGLGMRGGGHSWCFGS